MTVKASRFDLQVITHFLGFLNDHKALITNWTYGQFLFFVKLGTYRMSKIFFISPLESTFFIVPFPFEPTHLQTSFYFFLKTIGII
jgi:hypothetical protein